MFVSVCHGRGVVEPIGSRFGTRKIGDVMLTCQRELTSATKYANHYTMEHTASLI